MEYKLIVGLPGSGKSHLLSQLEKEGWRIIDDPCKIKSGIKDLIRPKFDTEKIAIADPYFCKQKSLDQFISLLPIEAVISFVYFENNPAAALKTRSQEERSTFRFIQELAKNYNPINPVKIWSPEENNEDNSSI